MEPREPRARTVLHSRYCKKNNDQLLLLLEWFHLLPLILVQGTTAKELGRGNCAVEGGWRMQELLAAAGGGGRTCMLHVQAAAAELHSACAAVLAGSSVLDNPKMLSILKEVKPLLAAAADVSLLEPP